MLHVLPTELLWHVFFFLDYEDIDRFLGVECLATAAAAFLQQHYPFQFTVAEQLRCFERMTQKEPMLSAARRDVASGLLHLLCYHVEQCPKFEQRTKFSELLDLMQQMVVDRVIDPTLPRDIETDYGHLCLDIRHVYLHTSEIRVLHDPKYRRRSTKHPLAPFLPRDYTWLWRQYCGYAKDWATGYVPPFWWAHPERPLRQRTALRFARFFGILFDVTSLYLESTLDGTFEECIREALVSGSVEPLLLLCVAAGKPLDVDGMCMSVSLAGEQLYSYLDTLDDYMTANPSPEQLARQQHEHDQREQQQQDNPMTPPEWLLPERYQVHPDTKLRLKMLCFLYNDRQWRWL